MSSTSRQAVLALLLFLLLGVAVPAWARPLQAGADGFGAVDWDSLVALQNSLEQREPEFLFGPIVGAMYLRVGDADFSAPIYGGSFRKDAYTLFLGDGRVGGNDRVRFAGLRFGLPTGLFFEVSGVDARQVIAEFNAYTHRAIGATGSVGYQWLGRRFHGSLSGGAGGFDLVTPKREESETALGLRVAGHAGFTF